MVQYMLMYHRIYRFFYCIVVKSENMSTYVM